MSIHLMNVTFDFRNYVKYLDNLMANKEGIVLLEFNDPKKKYEDPFTKINIQSFQYYAGTWAMPAIWLLTRPPNSPVTAVPWFSFYIKDSDPTHFWIGSIETYYAADKIPALSQYGINLDDFKTWWRNNPPHNHW